MLNTTICVFEKHPSIATALRNRRHLRATSCGVHLFTSAQRCADLFTEMVQSARAGDK